jgi:hypothetical protein
MFASICACEVMVSSPGCDRVPYHIGDAIAPEFYSKLVNISVRIHADSPSGHVARAGCSRSEPATGI